MPPRNNNIWSHLLWPPVIPVVGIFLILVVQPKHVSLARVPQTGEYQIDVMSRWYIFFNVFHYPEEPMRYNSVLGLV